MAFWGFEQHYIHFVGGHVIGQSRYSIYQVLVSLFSYRSRSSMIFRRLISRIYTLRPALCCIALLFQVVNAVCPNSCSGHGICDQYDICSCVNGADGKLAWTGNDCSLRTCPR